MFGKKEFIRIEGDGSRLHRIEEWMGGEEIGRSDCVG